MTQEKVEKDLLGDAITQAKEKAEHIASQLGMILDGAHAISDENFQNIESRYIPQKGSRYLAASRKGFYNNDREYYVPETIQISANIYVIYNLKNK